MDCDFAFDDILNVLMRPTDHSRDQSLDKSQASSAIESHMGAIPRAHLGNDVGAGRNCR